MALMEYREPNQVLWRGCRPGHNGTQVITNQSIGGGATATIYTVGAGQTLYITYLCAGISSDGGGLWHFTINPLGVNVYPMVGFAVAGSNFMPTVANFWPPIELEATRTVKITAGAGLGTIFGALHGWVE